MKNNHYIWALCSLALSMLLSSIGTSIPNVALPTLAEVFTASFAQVQWIILAYLLANLVLIVSVGRLGDLLGYRKVLMAGIILFVFSALLCGFSQSLKMLIFARVLQGFGAATLMSLTLAFVGEAVPKEKTGSAMGLLGTMSAIGTAAGPSIGGLLISYLSWRFIFFAMVPIGILSLGLAYFFLPKFEKPAGGSSFRFDFIGTALLGLSFASYALAVTVGRGAWGQFLPLIAVSLLSGLIFVLYESKIQTPLIRLNLLRDSTMSANLFMNILVSTVMMSTLVVGPFFLSRGLGLTPALVGALMSIGPAVSALSGVPAGRIVDRLGASAVTLIGLGEMAIGALAFAILPGIIGAIGYGISAALLSPGYQLFQAANNTSTMTKIPADQKGLLSGLLSVSRILGLITGTAVMGTIFSIPSSVFVGIKVTFLVATLLALAGFSIALILRVKDRKVKVQNDN